MFKGKLVGDWEDQQRLNEILRSLCFDEKLRGTQYLREAVFFYEPYMLMTKQLYPEIARRVGVKPCCVERNIRTAIDKAFTTCTDFLSQEKVFGALADTGEIPSVGTAVATLWTAMKEARGQ